MRKGQKQTIEAKEKISRANSGKKHLHRKSSPHTEKHKRNISIANKGGNSSSFRKGHIVSEEIRQKIRETNIKIGKKPPIRFGDKNNMWKGGISFEPYGLEFNEDLKDVIRNRDRRKCQLCEKTELENKEKLSIHHIDYDKQNNNPNNLISLCRKCHIKTNSNREYWINYFI